MKKNENGFCQWFIKTKDSGETIGRIVWDFCWRKYVFVPYPNTRWEEFCLTDITTFIVKQTDNQKVLE